jgi:hypothetical protein
VKPPAAFSQGSPFSGKYMMQKLVTLYLNAVKVKHGTVEEHLSDYLSEGWRIVSIAIAGGAGGFESTSAWTAIVLEKDSS